jgi:hypothetical protein
MEKIFKYPPVYSETSKKKTKNQDAIAQFLML